MLGTGRRHGAHNARAVMMANAAAMAHGTLLFAAAIASGASSSSRRASPIACSRCLGSFCKQA
jgi:hypothetical protein